MSTRIECQKRPENSKPRALRREGLLPAALYGHKGTESISLTVKTKDAETLLKGAKINNTLVDVSIPDLSWKGQALIREVQSHPWKRTLYHLSFFAVAGHGNLEVQVPIALSGMSPGVKAGGVMEQIANELTVECLPGRIPEAIEIDISNMDIGASMNAGEIVLPQGVALVGEPDITVLSVVAPTVPSAEGETAEEGELGEDAAVEETV
ncbi:MAG: 50S ribosomal protein L25/general stress protein Ctc [Cyanobacteriota bacterium]|nr:50S ribosomal protein L25/general stress protein Ctc [Cyanobacteriota bacterium]